MIGRFIDQIIPEAKLPLTLTSYSPCFRKEVGSHGLEERGVYRIHQFEKQEMIVVCRPEESMDWYNKLWSYSVELFRNLEIPVRQLECCSGDLADLKVKSCDIEAWSPRQKKYFEVCSCSNLGDAQARRLNIKVRGEDGKLYLLMPLPEGISREEVDKAVSAGVITLLDGMMADRPMAWEERNGELWYDTGIEGEVFGEKADSWVKAIDKDGYFTFATTRFVKV